MLTRLINLAGKRNINDLIPSKAEVEIYTELQNFEKEIVE